MAAPKHAGTNKISGEGEWKGLLDPLNEELRSALIRYGDMVFDSEYAFNGRIKNGCHGFPRYDFDHFFKEMGTERRSQVHYTITKFIFGYRSIPKEATWCGYVAVATDKAKEKLGRRDIVVCWRGTWLDDEWIGDFVAVPVPAPQIFGDILPHLDERRAVHDGFLNMYNDSNNECPYSVVSARFQVLNEVERLVNQYHAANEEVSITVTGHSMGAAIAAINALDIVANRYSNPNRDKSNPSCMVTVFAFAMPRPGNSVFKHHFEEHKDTLHLLSIENEGDRVPELPLTLLPPFDFVDIGVPLRVSYKESPYVKSYLKKGHEYQHNLDMYLHAVAGTVGDNKEKFDAVKAKAAYDVALVNRTLDALVNEYTKEHNIVPTWWVTHNKDMVQHEDGTYNLTENYYIPPPNEE